MLCLLRVELTASSIHDLHIPEGLARHEELLSRYQWRLCHAVAVQIYNLTVLLDVEKVAIGGGISKQPLLLESLRSAYDGLYASRAGQAYMEGLPRCQIVPCAFSSEANQVGVAAAYFEAMQKKC